MFLAAIVLSNFVGVSAVETFGSTVHRLGMLTGLVGGLLVVLAYRLEHLKQMMGWAVESRQRSKPMQGLFVLNVLAFLSVVFLSYFIGQSGRGQSSGWVYLTTMKVFVPITFAFMVTVAIWHGGYLRAYAIGFLVGVFVNLVSSLFTFQGRFWDWQTLILTGLATSMISGLVCSAYVYWLESCGRKMRDQIDRDSEQTV